MRVDIHASRSPPASVTLQRPDGSRRGSKTDARRTQTTNGSGAPRFANRLGDVRLSVWPARAGGIPDAPLVAGARDAYAQLLKDAPWLLVVNDLNPRVLSPTVHGFVMPQSWYVDLTNVWVK